MKIGNSHLLTGGSATVANDLDACPATAATARGRSEDLAAETEAEAMRVRIIL